MKQRIQARRIEIDEVKKKAEVERIVGSDYFQEIQAKARKIRERRKRKPKK